MWRVGLAGEYSQSIFKSPSIAASGSSDSYHIALYGGGQTGAWGVRGGDSFSWNDIMTSRAARGEIVMAYSAIFPGGLFASDS